MITSIPVFKLLYPWMRIIHRNQLWYHIYQSFVVTFHCLKKKKKKGSVPEQSSSPSPASFFSPLCTRFSPLPLTISGAAFKWAVEVQASTPANPAFLTTRLWSLCCFMNAWCNLRSEWSLWKSLHFPHLLTSSNLPSRGWAFCSRYTEGSIGGNQAGEKELAVNLFLTFSVNV